MATIESTAPAAVRPKQNWVVGPVADALFVIGAPVVALLLFAPIYAVWGISAVLFIFFGFNLGHHVPTFIRVYGDRGLLERFRWNLLLAPIIPFTLAMGGIAYLILAGYTIQTILFLYLILNIWDPWHFMMQNHGFMRIYDRHNLAPRKLAGRMDLALGWAWFIYIMVAAVNWLPDLFYSGQRLVGLPVLSLFRGGVFDVLQTIALGVAIATSVVYAGYLAWCALRGYEISRAKLCFFVVTYGVMYLTYVPNKVMAGLVADWTFVAGFATLGMVHVSQYLAIVWKYNRGLAQRHEDVREGVFVRTFGNGGAWVLLLYVGICLAYGFGLRGIMALNQVQTTAFLQQALMWIAGVALAINFTSTITHYYYDGFIWKIRHKENRRNLELQDDGDSASETASGETVSWWESRRVSPAAKTLLKQGLYFGVPMLLAIAGAVMVRNRDEFNPDAANLHWQAAQASLQAGKRYAALQEFRKVVPALDRRIETEKAMLEIRPTPAHYAMLAQAIDLRSHVLTYEMAALDGGTNPAELYRQRIEEARESIANYEKALELSAALGDMTDLNLNPRSREDVVKSIDELKGDIAFAEKELSNLQAAPASTTTPSKS